MSGKKVKAQRRAEGLTGEQRDSMREFEQRVRAFKATAAADDEIRSLAPKRLALAYAGMIVVVCVVALGFFGVR